MRSCVLLLSVILITQALSLTAIASPLTEGDTVPPDPAAVESVGPSGDVSDSSSVEIAGDPITANTSCSSGCNALPTPGGQDLGLWTPLATGGYVAMRSANGTFWLWAESTAVPWIRRAGPIGFMAWVGYKAAEIKNTPPCIWDGTCQSADDAPTEEIAWPEYFETGSQVKETENDTAIDPEVGDTTDAGDTAEPTDTAGGSADPGQKIDTGDLLISIFSIFASADGDPGPNIPAVTNPDQQRETESPESPGAGRDQGEGLDNLVQLRPPSTAKAPSATRASDEFDDAVREIDSLGEGGMTSFINTLYRRDPETPTRALENFNERVKQLERRVARDQGNEDDLELLEATRRVRDRIKEAMGIEDPPAPFANNTAHFIGEDGAPVYAQDGGQLTRSIEELGQITDQLYEQWQLGTLDGEGIDRVLRAYGLEATDMRAIRQALYDRRGADREDLSSLVFEISETDTYQDALARRDYWNARLRGEDVDQTVQIYGKLVSDRFWLWLSEVDPVTYIRNAPVSPSLPQ